MRLDDLRRRLDFLERQRQHQTQAHVVYVWTHGDGEPWAALSLDGDNDAAFRTAHQQWRERNDSDREADWDQHRKWSGR